jgi:hypothetical protein
LANQSELSGFLPMGNISPLPSATENSKYVWDAPAINNSLKVTGVSYGKFHPPHEQGS